MNRILNLAIASQLCEFSQKAKDKGLGTETVLTPQNSSRLCFRFAQ